MLYTSLSLKAHRPIDSELERATVNQSLDGVKRAIQRGANPHFLDDPTDQYTSILGLAASHSDPEIVTFLLVTEKWSVHELSKALVMAADYCAFKAAQLLIAWGAKIDFNFNEPLRCAVKTGDLEMAAFLIKQGADTTDSEVLFAAGDLDFEPTRLEMCALLSSATPRGSGK